MLSNKKINSNYFKLKEGTGFDQKLEHAYDKLGEYYADLRDW